MRHTLVPSTVATHTVSPVQITSPPAMQTQSHTTKTVVTTHTTVPTSKVTAWITIPNPATTTSLPKPPTTTTLPRTHSTLPTTQIPLTVCELMLVSVSANLETSKLTNHNIYKCINRCHIYLIIKLSLCSHCCG